MLDATETGERGLCAPFDRRRLRDEPLMELVDAYFGGIWDASRRPNSELYKWLKSELASRQVQGIIFRRYLWCDMWHAELGRLKDFSGLPVLDIDTAGDNNIERQRTENRIRASSSSSLSSLSSSRLSLFSRTNRRDTSSWRNQGLASRTMAGRSAGTSRMETSGF